MRPGPSARSASLRVRDTTVGAGVSSLTIAITTTSPRSPVLREDILRRLASWLIILIPLTVAVAGAWSYRWVQEDAFINFRIVANLLSGHGPVYNVGERVEVYSDPLWLFLLAGLHRVLPFLSLEWLAVLLGLAGTGGGVILSARAVQRLGGRNHPGVVVPLGLLVFASVAGVWEFSTSGLEMSMVFLWIGFTFWLLVRTEHLRHSAVRCGFVAGLGTLVRPELVLMSVVFLVALVLVVSGRGWQGPTSFIRRYLTPLLAAIALPVLYQIWRMAYFAMVVPNTALAKSAGSTWWSQGGTYLWNFVSPYTLWLPFGLALFLVIPRSWRWWQARDRMAVIVLLTPVAAAVVDGLYVTRIGGDYQHARLLLPAFLALCLPVWFEVKQVRSLAVVPIIGIVVWSVASAGWLRYSSGDILSSDHGIADERTVWIRATGSAHPIRAVDYHSRLGSYYARLAERSTGRHDQVVVLTPHALATVPTGPPDTQPAASVLPFHLAVKVGAIGVTGYLSGPAVYIFDAYSLANPIGSHFAVGDHARPGQEKYIDQAWMIARFGTPADVLPANVSSGSVTAARHALSCAPLRSYLHAVTAPFGLSQAISDVTHSLSYTRMRFSPDPTMAEHELCRGQ